MAEQTQNEAPETDVPVEPEVKQNFVTRTAVKFPRTARVVAITGGVVAVGGALIIGNTVKKNKRHLELAADHAQEALTELSSSVSPTDTEA
jgi:hypothetical protein